MDLARFHGVFAPPNGLLARMGSQSVHDIGLGGRGFKHHESLLPFGQRQIRFSDALVGNHPDSCGIAGLRVSKGANFDLYYNIFVASCPPGRRLYGRV